ncbi:MAG: hypothetical protein ACRDH7_17505 [Actinomycetota bacterium]
MGAVRDHGLSLACLRQGLTVVQARSFDDLTAETRHRFDDAHVGGLDLATLRAALAASVLALLREGEEARLLHAHVVAERLADIG